MSDPYFGKPHPEIRRCLAVILHPSRPIFLTVYTILVDRKMCQLLIKRAKERAARKVANIVKDLPPEDKGAILLKKWEREA